MEGTQVLTQKMGSRSRRGVNKMLRLSVNASRVMSIIFTPFYMPLVGMIALFSFSYLSLLPLSYKLFVLLIVSLHHPCSYDTDPFLQKVSGMVNAETSDEGRTYGAIRHLHHVLFHVLLHTQLFPLPSFHELNSGSGTIHTDSLCYHKRVVQDINPHNGHRRLHRQSCCLCRAL